MATAEKHMLRSHRSYQKKVDFSGFEHHAKMKSYKKVQKKSLGEKFKGLFKRGDK